MKVDGACHCGQIAFEAEVDAARVVICHCTDCQSLSGTAFRVSVPTAERDFRLLRGDPKEYRKLTAASGLPRIQAFCGACGSPLYSTSVDGDNRTFNIRAGTLSQRAELVPKRQIWCQSELPWLPELPGTASERG